jgi:hypothetical protein
VPEPATPGAPIRTGARYGRTAGTRRRDVGLLIGLGAAVIVAIAAWLVWGGWNGLNELVGGSGGGPSISADSGSDNVLDARRVEVSYTVTAPAGVPVACAIEAEDVNFTVTGWKVVRLPISSETTRSFTTTVRTVAPSVTGDVSSCWSSARD